MAERVAVRDITNEEGNKLLQIVRRGSGSVVRWRRAQIVLWSAQRMDVPAIAKIAFTSEDRVREVIHNFNADGFDSLAPKYTGGRPPKFSVEERAAVKMIALGRPTDYGEPFSTWSLTKLADHLVRKGVVDDISHEGLRALLREEGVSFQAIKTWKQSNDPDFEVKKNRVLELYDIADGKAQRRSGDPDVVICYDEFGPLNLQPHPGRHWAERDTKGAPRSGPRRRMRATFVRPHGVRHLLAAYDLSTDKLYGHVKAKKGRTDFLSFMRYVRTLHPAHVRIAIILDNFSPHLSTKVDQRVGDWAQANNVELAYTPHYASWLNRIEAQFTALRYFTLDGTDHESHEAQGFLIRRYIAWRNRNAHNETLRELVKRANVA
ncbi:MAG TPA: IS630 family transposase [Acidimicrobiales bacterium]|nr:IS630 family transposase [Acidimicrobiales bacterium]